MEGKKVLIIFLRFIDGLKSKVKATNDELTGVNSMSRQIISWLNVMRHVQPYPKNKEK